MTTIRASLGLLVCLAICARLSGQGISIQKEHNFVQTDATTLVDDTNHGAWGFLAYTTGVSDDSGPKSITDPNGQTYKLAYDASNQEWVYGPFSYSSQASLDQSFPVGIYQFELNGQYGDLSLKTNLYPNAPLVSVSGGAWENGVLQIDPTAAEVLTLNFSTNYNAIQSFMTLDVVGPAGSPKPVDLSAYTYNYDVPDNSSNKITLKIPANSLANGTYTGTAVLASDEHWDDEPQYTYYSESTYATQNTFVIQVGPKPTPTPTPTPTPVASAPEITLQPWAWQSVQTLPEGHTASFSVQSSGTPSPSIQWYLNGTAIPGATDSVYAVSNANAANAGTYTCTVTNSAGAVTSNGATLLLANGSSQGRLINLSCRADSTAGATQLIAGYVIGGANTSGSETVLIRATGPTLSSFGLSGVLPDPELTLSQSVGSSNTLVATNKGWGGNTLVASTAASVGAFSWNGSSVDAALVETLGDGGYTAQVTGIANDSGIALVEVYDATPSGSYTVTSPRLINISARVEVGTGGNILIAGFVIGGTTSETVLIRASGPVLTNFGLSGNLPDPQLSLFQSNSDGSNTLLQTNTGWGGNTQIAAVASQVGAFSWGTKATPDSAILVTLPPGAYTAEVTGATGDTGISLVEVYEVQ